MKKRRIAIALLPLALCACNLVEVTNEEAQNPDSAEQVAQDVPVRETKNVTYEGEVQPAGISIYQQGSHRLVLPGGKFILLESDSLDLNGYVGEKVRIFGALRPTVEAGGQIMRVERIELIEPALEASSSSADSSVSSEEQQEESFSSSDEAMSENSSSEERESSAESDVSSEESSSSETSSSESSVSSISEPSVEVQEQIDVMSRQEYTAGNWTQQYCTSHIGFCVPVHRNWWFKSFGATNTTLWHVEFSSAPIDKLHQGPIVVDLIAGSAEDQDGTVDVTGGKATGYKEWTFGRHFRISGDDSLEEAVRYMTTNITEYAQ